MNNKFIFKPLDKKDLELIYTWYQEPIVKKLYAKDKTWSMNDINNWYLPRLQGQQHIPSYIVHYKNTPIGFIHHYSLANFLPDGMKEDRVHQLFEIYRPDETGGIDMFITDAARTLYGKGCGSALLSEFLDLFVKSNYKQIVLDPAADNIPAIKCYEKCGFEYFSTEYKAEGDKVYLMKLKQY